MNFYVVYKKENSHQSSDDEEEVDTCNPPAPQKPANQSDSIDNNMIQVSVSTPKQPSSPIQEFQTSVSPIPAKRIRTRGRAHICGGPSVSQVPQTQVEQRKRNPKNDTSDSSDDNAEVDDSDNDDNNNVDSFEWNDTPTPLRQFPFIGTPGVKVEPADITSHLECLKFFFLDNVISNVVEYTNSYAETMQNLPEIRRRMDESSSSLFS